MNSLAKGSDKLKTALAVLVAVAALGYLGLKLFQGQQRPKGSIWFYNLATHELFPASDMGVPPIDTKSGPATGVRAYVYTCGGDANRFIAFLEKFTPEVKQGVEEDLKKSGDRMSIGFALEKRPNGILVSAPEKEAWVPKFSDEGREVMETGKRKGGCTNATPSLP